MSWGAVEWTAYEGKHSPNKGTSWEVIRENTRGKRQPAKYNCSVAEQKRLELSVVERDGSRETSEEPIVLARGRCILPGSFFQIYHVAPGIVGASNGQDTNIVMVQWNEEPEGSLHGHPITEEELKAFLRRNDNAVEIAVYEKIKQSVKQANRSC